MNKIGQYIKKLRKAKGITQQQLADTLNVSFQAVSKWETGETLPDVALLLDLCNELNTTADMLLNGG
ncbi:MAG: helix-turn-helix transcriptional regulator, partial [Clostridia bacterium]|nr:helix-turn-helix transcriptional regulator [Clostridia bacterium]